MFSLKLNFLITLLGLNFDSVIALKTGLRDLLYKSTFSIWYIVLCAQSHLTACILVDCSLLGSSLRGISLVTILEWVSISFSRGSSQPRDWTHIFCLGRQILYHWAARETTYWYSWLSNIYYIHSDIWFLYTNICDRKSNIIFLFPWNMWASIFWWCTHWVLTKLGREWDRSLHSICVTSFSLWCLLKNTFLEFGSQHFYTTFTWK